MNKNAHPWVLRFSHIWRKVLFVLLCLLALEELTSAVSFFVFEYPELDTQLKEHLLTDTEMKHLTARAFAESANSVINMFFATRLMKARERLTHVLDLISGSTLVIWQETVTRWLEALNIPTLWERFF